MSSTQQFVTVDHVANAGVVVEIDGKPYTFTGLSHSDLGRCIRAARGVALAAWRLSTAQPQTAQEYMMYRLELNNILFGQYGQSALEFPMFPEVQYEMIVGALSKTPGQIVGDYHGCTIRPAMIRAWMENNELRETLLQTILTLTSGASRVEKGAEPDPPAASPIGASTNR